MHNSKALDGGLQGIPQKYRKRIIDTYLSIKHRYEKARFDGSYDASGLSCGKFVETVYRFLEWRLLGKTTPFGKSIPNMSKAVRDLIETDKSKGPESLRVIIPRALMFLYTMRNKRGIGHVGGDVQANEIDANTIVRVCDWIICELIRVYHGVSLQDAQGIVDTLATRSMPYIWEVSGRKRVLDAGMSYRDKTLVIVYSDAHEGVHFKDLVASVEYSNPSAYRTTILKRLHAECLIDFDIDSNIVRISPTGIAYVESNLLKQEVGSQA